MADTIKSIDVPAVHGIVALNPDGTTLGTPVGGATSANQTSGDQKTQIVDSSGESVTVTGGKLDVNATASLAGESIPATGATEAVAVQIVDGSGDQISSFGGGTQYTEGDTDASITGTAFLFENNTTTNALSAVSADNPLPVLASIDTTGLATSANQTTIIGHVDGIETLLGTIDADTSNIATNSSTIAGDTTSIDAKTPALGQALAASSVPVVLPAAQITTLTPQTDALTDTQLRAAAVPVSGTFWQATQPVSASSLPLPTGASTAAKQPALGTAGTASADVITVQGITSMTPLKVDGSGVTQPVSGTFWQATQPVSLASVPSHAVTNAGTFATQATLQTGSNAIGKLAANSGVDIGDVDVTSIAAGSNLIGDVGIGVRTSGGTTLYKNIDVDETEDQVKATAGQVYWIHAINLTAAPIYLKFYNATAANVTVGTTVPDLTFPVPANADSDGAGFALSIANGIAFSTAITIAGTTGVADNDSGAPAANALVVNLGYN